MDFVDQLRAIATRIPRQMAHLHTEEATKNALILPFINALGYNVFDPTEVIPEYTADVGTKKGEKVDYAIMKDGEPVMLWECKWAGLDLDDAHASQLLRYFTVTSVRFGVLTNGISYRFFSDLDNANRMDSKPFFEFYMPHINDATAEELKKFTRSSFELDWLLDTARELKYTKEIRRILSQEFLDPSDEFVRFFASQVYSGRMTQSVKEQFTDLTKRAFQQYINDRISDRLKSALDSEGASNKQAPPSGEEEPTEEQVDQEQDQLAISDEEQEAFFIIKATLREVVSPERIVLRPAKSYKSVLLDDNNRKPICRLRFSGTRMTIGVMDENKKEDRVTLSTLDDLYGNAERFRSRVLLYDDSD